MALTTWTIEIDFDNDGFGSGDDITQYVMNADWNVGFNAPYQYVAPSSECSLVVRNDDKRFSPEYSSSPYFGKLTRGKPVRISADDGVTSRVMYVGYLHEIRPEYGTGRNKTAQIKCVDAKYYMEKSKATPPLWENVTADEVVAWFALNVQAPASFTRGWVMGVGGRSEIGTTTYIADVANAYSLETGLHTYPYIGDTWDEEAINAMAMVADVVNAERGRLFFDRTGKLTFWNRHHLLKKTTNDATITNAHGMDYSFGENVRNVVKANVYPRTISAGSNEVLYSSDNDISVAGQTTRKLRTSFRDPSLENAKISGRNVAKPSTAAGTLVHTGGSLNITMERHARSVTLEIENTDTTDATITLLEVRGQKLTAYEREEVIAEDLSALAFGREELTFDMKVMDDLVYAESLVNYELVKRKNALGEVRMIRVIERDGTTQGYALDLATGNRINLQDAQLGHNADHYVVGERHTLRDAFGEHHAELFLERADTALYWQIGVVGYGEVGQATRVAV